MSNMIVVYIRVTSVLQIEAEKRYIHLRHCVSKHHCIFWQCLKI